MNHQLIHFDHIFTVLLAPACRLVSSLCWYVRTNQFQHLFLLITPPLPAQGIATMIADGISMGLGEYLGTVAEIDYFHQEKSRERWELENNPDGVYS